MKEFINWLNKPYFFTSSSIFKLKISLNVIFFVFLFFFFFKPFGISGLEDNYFEFCISVSFIAGIVTFLWLLFPSKVLKENYLENKWTVKINIFYIFIGLFICGSLCWLYVAKINPRFNLENRSYWQVLGYTFLCGFGPLTTFVFINEKATRERRIKKAKKLSTLNLETEKKRKVLDKNVKLFSENKKEHLSLNIDNLIYVTSQGNYASFYLKKEGEKLKEYILRVTLSQIEKELDEFDFIVRFHKSYIVNSKYISSFNGNARGYLLNCELVDFEIPVSRSYDSESLKNIFAKN